ncbi:hypothetical protein HPO96_36010 [Kribbella sandramycini]|uniref:Uncharacterized protein n=1 Tax=Kribbella sandramycini TaxID=60450 RepID=A0A7Y4P2Q8_9ACTN|nr:hypothetical protein [Kribbella sandramycini]MBB6568896.1 hypothetical protein [Kribbella sandramycini]NOL45662.1 hypothetical protein [Kribbella sandramycini]
MSKTVSTPAGAAGQLCDQHGSALLSLATAMTRDPLRARRAVVDVIHSASAHRPGAVRSELVRHLFERCGGAESVSARPAGERRDLVLYLACESGLTYQVVAELTNLQPADVAGLISEGLRHRS